MNKERQLKTAFILSDISLFFLSLVMLFDAILFLGAFDSFVNYLFNDPIEGSQAFNSLFLSFLATLASLCYFAFVIVYFMFGQRIKANWRDETARTILATFSFVYGVVGLVLTTYLMSTDTVYFSNNSLLNFLLPLSCFGLVIGLIIGPLLISSKELSPEQLASLIETALNLIANRSIRLSSLKQELEVVKILQPKNIELQHTLETNIEIVDAEIDYLHKLIDNSALK